MKISEDICFIRCTVPREIWLEKEFPQSTYEKHLLTTLFNYIQKNAEFATHYFAPKATNPLIIELGTKLGHIAKTLFELSPIYANAAEVYM